MNIFITGASGMVGKNITAVLKGANHRVMTPSHDALNLLNYSEVERYVRSSQPDVIVHCAGRVGGIHANMKEPARFLIENLEMGKNVVLAAREARVTYLLNMGTSCMYPRNAKNPLKETSLLQGEPEPTNEGYALAKISVARLCSYIMAEDPHYQYKTLVPCNIYGPWDSFDRHRSHMIPAVIRKIHEAIMEGKSTVEIWGDGTARREFMYVGDLAEFVLFALQHIHQLPEMINVGLGYDYSINEYYTTIASILGFTGSFVHNLDKPVGMKQKVVDVSRADNLGWKASTTLETGIEKTLAFFKKHILQSTPVSDPASGYKPALVNPTAVQ